jgi:hypothetical protein
MDSECICINKQLLLCKAKKHKCVCDLYKPKIIIKGMGFEDFKHYCKACIKNLNIM